MQIRIFYLIYAKAHSKWSYFIGLKIEKLNKNIKDDLLLKSKVREIIVCAWHRIQKNKRLAKKKSF